MRARSRRRAGAGLAQERHVEPGRRPLGQLLGRRRRQGGADADLRSLSDDELGAVGDVPRDQQPHRLALVESAGRHGTIVLDGTSVTTSVSGLAAAADTLALVTRQLGLDVTAAHQALDDALGRLPTPPAGPDRRVGR